MQRQAPLRDSSISGTAFNKKIILDTFRPNLKPMTKQRILWPAVSVTRVTQY